jgi:hypothetical protein
MGPLLLSPNLASRTVGSGDLKLGRLLRCIDIKRAVYSAVPVRPARRALSVNSGNHVFKFGRTGGRQTRMNEFYRHFASPRPSRSPRDLNTINRWRSY